VSFDGKVVTQGGRWGDKEAFKIGETSVTNEEAATVSGVVIALIVLSVVICCFFSYIERDKIKEEGRKASIAIRRASTKLRGGSVKEFDEKEKEMTDKDIER